MTPGSYPTFTPGAFNGAPGTITRKTGDWLTEGFTADSYIRVSNSLSNDGFWHVSGVTATTLLVDGIGTFSQESGDSAVTIEAGHLNSGNPGLTFSSVPNGNGGVTSTITRSTGSWIGDGFEFGQSAWVLFTPDANGDGAGDNDGDYVVIGVTDLVLTVDAGPGLRPAGSGLQRHRLDSGLPGGHPDRRRRPEQAARSHARSQLDFGTNAAGQGTITRSDGGDWSADLFAVGQLATRSWRCERERGQQRGLLDRRGERGGADRCQPVGRLQQQHHRGHRLCRDEQRNPDAAGTDVLRRDHQPAGADGTWTSNGFVAGLAVTVGRQVREQQR